MDLGWRLEAGGRNGDPFDASTGELPLIFALSFPFIWLIQLLSLVGNGLRKRVMYSLHPSIFACPFFFLATSASCNELCSHLCVPVHAHHRQPKVITCILPPLHILIL